MATKQICDYCGQENFIEFTKEAETEDFKIELRKDMCELCIKKFKKFLDEFVAAFFQTNEKLKGND